MRSASLRLRGVGSEWPTVQRGRFERLPVLGQIVVRLVTSRRHFATLQSSTAIIAVHATGSRTDPMDITEMLDAPDIPLLQTRLW